MHGAGMLHRNPLQRSPA